MRVSGTYESVVRGVSEQVPQDRREGQHTAVKNMLQDPVQGAARRWGSEAIYRQGAGFTAYNSSFKLAAQAMENFDVTLSGKDYSFVHRRVSQQHAALNYFLFDKSSGNPVVVHEQSAVGGAVAAIYANGVSAVTTAGDLLLIAANNYLPTISYPSGAEANLALSRTLGAVWIRAGAYSRKYTMTVVPTTGATAVVSYTTPTASYQGTLDTSDILTSDPDYTKKVNDRVNAYNGAVTAWVGTATASIQPAFIAAQLQTLAAAALVGTTGVATIQDAYIAFAGIKSIIITDGGDGTYARAVDATIQDVSQLTPRHYTGQVVELVSNTRTKTGVYYVARAKDGTVSNGVFTDVVWEEGPEVPRRLVNVFAVGAVLHNQLFIADSPALLQTLINVTYPGQFVVPLYADSASGDADSNPDPTFIGKQIDYLGVFQDRLIVGNGGQLSCSKQGDYFNYFTTSQLVIADTDPVSVFALGSENDTIKYDEVFDKNLLLFGEKKQYTISGRTALSPRNPLVTAASAHEGTIPCRPRASGNYVFFAKRQADTTTLHQFQFGAVAEAIEAYEVSQQLDKFIVGNPHELITFTAPNYVVMRTKEEQQRLFLYTYLDSAEASSRLFDAWSDWEWSPALGVILGIAKYQGHLLVYTAREDINGLATLVTEKFVFVSSLSPRPYADSLRPWSIGDYEDTAPAYVEDVVAVADSSSDYYMMGSTVEDEHLFDVVPETELDAHGWIGVEYDAALDPTNPYYRDRNNKVVLGKLTLSKVIASVANTGGMDGYVSENDGTPYRTMHFNGRILGSSLDLIGRQPVVKKANLTIPIGKDNENATYSIRALRWLPLTVTSISWLGQFFNHSRGN